MESAHQSAALGSRSGAPTTESLTDRRPRAGANDAAPTPASPHHVLLLTQSRRHPLLTLVFLFAAWKLYLLAIAFLAGSVGPAYDTSGALLRGAASSPEVLADIRRSAAVHGTNASAGGIDITHGPYSVYTTATPTARDNALVTRLTSWDAIYYVESARRGYVFEQEWAFGTGLAILVSALHDVFSHIFSLDISEALIAVVVAHVSHLVSVLVLYRLGRLIWPGSDNGENKSNDSDGNGNGNLAFVAACLHIISPGGLFLSAPNAESTFACLSFVGYAAYASGIVSDTTAASHGSGGSRRAHSQPTTDDGPSGVSVSHGTLQDSAPGLSTPSGPSSPTASSATTSVSPTASSFRGDLLRLLAGILFGLATTFRSNGILNGIPFAYEAVVGLTSLLQRPDVSAFRRLIFVGMGGVATATGLIVPQAVAYMQFCLGPSGVPGEDLRPWCTQTLPSIYTFVQEHYWNVGFLRYWTPSNVPLFLLAAPMLFVLIRSGLDTLSEALPSKKGGTEDANSGSLLGSADPRLVPLVLCWTSAQLLLACLAITNYHVQIISRISCSYTVWYWWLAQSLAGGPRVGLAGGIVIFMVMYASIQGVLFASFLPPA